MTYPPRSLNLSSIQTPVMKQLMGGTREVLLGRQEEKLAAMEVFAVPREVLAKIFHEELKTGQNRLRHMMSELGWRSESAKRGGVDNSRTVWFYCDYQVVGGRVKGRDGYDESVCPIQEEAKDLGAIGVPVYSTTEVRNGIRKPETTLTRMRNDFMVYLLTLLLFWIRKEARFKAAALCCCRRVS